MSSTFKRIERQDIPTSIAAEIRSKVFDGTIAPGTALRQEELAEQFSTSRIPVREALRQLEAEGIVRFEINKGATVVPLSLSEVEELFEMRALLEPHILSQALPKHTEIVWKQAQEANSRMASMLDQTPWGDSNWEFHRILYAPANKKKLLATIEMIRVQSERFAYFGKVTDYKKDAVQEHSDIIAACRGGDVSAATSALRQHIVEAGDELVKCLKLKNGGSQS